MPSLLVKNGRVVDPANKRDEVCDVLIEGGKVARIGKNIPMASVPASAETFDASGLVAAPGFVDMHVHLREPGQEHKETIASGAAAAVAGGFASAACMANTDPVNDNQNVTRFIRKRAEETGLANVFPIGAISKGLKGEELAEMGDMAEEGIVAVSDDGVPLADAELMRRALEYAKIFDFPVINHAEDPALVAGGTVNEGTVSARMGLRGRPAAAEATMVARDIALAELTGGRLHVPHLSTRAALGMVREAKRKGLRVTCEVSPHHLLLSDEACLSFDTSTRVNPPLRSKDDIEALREGLADGSIDAVASDHAPHHWDEKDCEFPLAPPGMVGLETAVALMLDRFIHAKLMDWKRLVELMSLSPCRILNLKTRGHLSPGAEGDMTLLDPEARITVTPENFQSRARNTPFGGWNLCGSPAATIVAGRLVWKRGS
jgi:dihydroorotase